MKGRRDKGGEGSRGKWTYAPLEGSGAKPQPLANFVHFISYFIHSEA